MKRFLLCALLVCGAARAQTATGIVADRFVPAVGPVTLFGTEGAAVTPYAQLSWALSIGYAQDLIKLVNALTGELVTRPVANQTTFDLSGELGLYKRRVAIAFGLPVAADQAGDGLAVLAPGAPRVGVGGLQGGDFRLRLKVLLAGDPLEAGLHLGVSLQLTFPFGGEASFAASQTVTVTPRLHADYRIGLVQAVATVGVTFAPERTLAQTTFGDELVWSAGAGVALFARRGVWGAAIAEFAGGVGASAGTRPAEVRSGFRAGLRTMSLDVGAGAGLDADVGAPSWRVFAVFRQAVPFD